jgi:GntR family transcriptional regulator
MQSSNRRVKKGGFRFQRESDLNRILPEVWKGWLTNMVAITYINRESKVPLYQQLYEILRGNIVRGEWKVGYMIPPEPELIDLYQVSRTTVRQVLDMLVSEGLIYRQQGRGSFVAKPTLEQGLTRIISFTDDMRNRGLVPGTRVIFSGLVEAPGEVAENLQVPTGTELVQLERLRLANGEPMSIEESYLVHSLCPGILEFDYAKNPLREALDKKYGIQLVRAKQIIRSVQSSQTTSNLLEIPPKSPLLFIERVTFSQDSIPVEFLRIYFRGDRYSLYNELQG